jgi:uroporphyrinogen-III synthase
LAGKRILITRAVAQSEGLFDALCAAGAQPVLFPLIKIVLTEDSAPLDAALSKLRDGDWIFFTSQNAVDPVTQRARALRPDFFADTAGIQIAAVGPASEKAAQFSGWRVRYVAKTSDGVSLAHELGELLPGRRILLPRSDLADDSLPAAVREFGGEAIEVVAYRTERAREVETQLAAILTQGAVDAIVCFSASAVRALMDILPSKVARASLRDEVTFVAVGPVTAKAFHDAGIQRPLIAAHATPESAVEILWQHFGHLAPRHLAGAKKR